MFIIPLCVVSVLLKAVFLLFVCLPQAHDWVLCTVDTITVMRGSCIWITTIFAFNKRDFIHFVTCAAGCSYFSTWLWVMGTSATSKWLKEEIPRGNYTQHSSALNPNDVEQVNEQELSPGRLFKILEKLNGSVAILPIINQSFPWLSFSPWLQLHQWSKHTDVLLP